MEIVADLEQTVTCSACGLPIHQHACCFHHNGWYYHPTCFESKRPSLVRTCYLDDCDSVSNRALAVQKSMGAPYASVYVRQSYASQLDTLTNLEVKYLITEILLIGDRIMYALPIEAEPDAEYRKDLEEVYHSRQLAVNTTRARYMQTKNTWSHDVAMLAPPPAAAPQAARKDPTELLSIANLDEEARAANALTGINPTSSHAKFEEDIQSAVKKLDALEVSEATPLAEAHQEVALPAKSKGVLKRTSSAVVNKIFKPLTSALPGFSTILDWLKTLSPDKLSPASIKQHLGKMAEEKLGAQGAGHLKTFVGFFFDKVWHLIEPGIQYVLMAGKKALGYASGHKMDTIKSLVPIGSGDSAKKTFSLANLVNLAMSIFSALKWIVPLISKLISYGSAAV